MDMKYMGYAFAGFVAAALFPDLSCGVPARPHAGLSRILIRIRRAGFHIIQSMIAVSTGGITGLGLMEGKQKLFYLPEPHTDFIFAVTARRTGPVGMRCSWRCLASFYIAASARHCAPQDMFGKISGDGHHRMVVVQAFINISVVLG